MGPAETAEIVAVLDRLANDLITPTFIRFAEQARVLDEAVAAWAAAPDDAALREVAREAWVGAMLTWQHAELMQLGPAGPQGQRVGGDDIRDRVYSWPTARPCRVDQLLVDDGYAEAGWLDNALFDVQGLDAVEYLLFVETSANACPAAVRINREGLWEARFGDQPEALARGRAAYAAVVASGVRAAGDALVAAFAGDGDDFASALAAGSAPYESPAEALDQVYAALFYLDKIVKDTKLGRVLGLAEGCDLALCPEAVESRYSGRGAPHLAANLESFEALFFGDVAGEAGAGLDDLLRARDAAAVVERMSDNLAAARAAVSALSPDLATALETDPDAVRAVHTAVKAVTTDLKGEVMSILDLEVPREGAGDSD